MTGVLRQNRSGEVTLSDPRLLARLVGFAVVASVNGHAQAHVVIGSDRGMSSALPTPQRCIDQK